MLKQKITVRSAFITGIVAFFLGMGTFLVATPAPVSAPAAITYQVMTLSAGAMANTLKTQGNNGWEVVSAVALSQAGNKSQVLVILKKAR